MSKEKYNHSNSARSMNKTIRSNNNGKTVVKKKKEKEINSLVK